MKSEELFNLTKTDIRKLIKQERKSIHNKKQADKAIREILFDCDFYVKAKTILCYVSLPDEISTDEIIEKALSDGKKVAVAFCENSDGLMSFYYIDSLKELIIGSFGIREPDPNLSKCVDSFADSVIILPGLCFDERGNRLGYGKGYYDRYLQNNALFSVGLCYNSLVFNKLPSDEYDMKANVIITDSRIIYCENGGKNG